MFRFRSGTASISLPKFPKFVIAIIDGKITVTGAHDSLCGPMTVKNTRLPVLLQRLSTSYSVVKEQIQHATWVAL